MVAFAFDFSDPHTALSRQVMERISALIFLSLVILITGSCATNAQAAGKALTVAGTLPNGSISQPYSGVLWAIGGSAPYRFSVVSGSLPPGVSLNSANGLLSGAPSASGSYTFQILVTDAPYSYSGSQNFTIQISGGSSQGGISVNISPSGTTLAPGAKQQFTATVTGTSDTAVIWSASSGSINSTGLYTAPSVHSALNATVTATSRVNTAQSASVTVTVTPNQIQPLQITTSGLAPGEQGSDYSAAFTATGGTPPYSWNLASGNLPSGLTLNASGDLAGMPNSTGTFTFVVQVTDANNLTATANSSLTVSQGSGYDGPAQLPKVSISTPMSESPALGLVINVGSGGNLQSALNQAQCGQTIQLEAGATFTGVFKVPAKNCDAGHWIIIRTSSPDSALPAEGQRLTPCYAGVASLPGRPAYDCSNPANVLAKVQMTQQGDGPFQIENGANFYRFLGLEITREIGAPGEASLITLMGTADHIFVDRSWLHGQVHDETHVGFSASGGTNIAVIDSYFTDFHCIAVTGTCTDAHAISGGVGNTQDGPYLIQNNFLEASGEEVMFGGGAATTTPTDITVQYNHFWKPWQWMPGNPNFVGGANGNPFIVKNHFELKNAVRVLVQDNLMENCWGGFTQTGFSILLTPVNQHTQYRGNVCPLCQVTDVTLRYNQISHSGSGIQIATEISPNLQIGAPALLGTRFSIHDLVMDDLSTNYVGQGIPFEIDNGWPKNPLNTITINHVTAFPDSNSHMMITANLERNAKMYGFVFTNNLMSTGAHPIWDSFGAKNGVSCSVKDVPIISISTCFATYTFQSNGLIGSPSVYPPSSWPADNFFPASPEAVEFVNYNGGNGGNYELQPSSPYKNKGTDGRDLGADVVGLQQQLAGVE